MLRYVEKLWIFPPPTLNCVEHTSRHGRTAGKATFVGDLIVFVAMGSLIFGSLSQSDSNFNSFFVSEL